MKKAMIILSVAVSTLLLSGCGGGATTDANIQPHKIKRTVNPTTIGDMTLAVKNTTDAYSFTFSLTDTSKHSQIYIDTDKKRATGFTPWDEGGVGAEFLLEDGNLFKYKGIGGDDFDNNWELVSWGEDDITSRDIAFDTLGNLDAFNVQGVLLDYNWDWDSSSDVKRFVKKFIPTGQQVTREQLIEMIKNNEDVTQADISGIKSMAGLFYQQSNFNQDISGWDVSNVTNMTRMFHDAKSFNQDISSWNVSNVTSMRDMFYGATAFNQDIGDWDVSNVFLKAMFHGAKSFNQDVGSWDVSNATNLMAMFRDATSFNQDLSGWDVSNVTRSASFASGSAMIEENLPKFR